MTLTATQLADFRADIGDATATVFTDIELNRLYERASENYAQAIVLALRQLLANAAKLHDYRLAQSTESLSQVFSNVKQLLQYWEERVDEETAGTAGQIRIIGLRGVPPRDKDLPSV